MNSLDVSTAPRECVASDDGPSSTSESLKLGRTGAVMRMYTHCCHRHRRFGVVLVRRPPVDIQSTLQEATIISREENSIRRSGILLAKDLRLGDAVRSAATGPTSGAPGRGTGPESGGCWRAMCVRCSHGPSSCAGKAVCREAATGGSVSERDRSARGCAPEAPILWRAALAMAPAEDRPRVPRANPIAARGPDRCGVDDANRRRSSPRRRRRRARSHRTIFGALSLFVGIETGRALRIRCPYIASARLRRGCFSGGPHRSPPWSGRRADARTWVANCAPMSRRGRCLTAASFTQAGQHRNTQIRGRRRISCRCAPRPRRS